MKRPLISGMPIDPKDIVDQEVQKYLGDETETGVAVGLVQGNTNSYFNFGLTHRNTGTPIDQNTVFILASVQKVFTSTLCAAQVVQNKMSLSTQITDYLPKEVGDAGNTIRQVTPLDLATMTSGMPDRIPNEKGFHPGYNLYRDQPPDPKLIAYWQNNGGQSNGFNPTDKIGTKELYSNVGVVTLAFATVNASGATGYTTLLQETITDPLEMEDTVVDVSNIPPERIAQGYNKKGLPIPPDKRGVGLSSTTQDMVNFLRANLFLNSLLPPVLTQAMSLAQTPHFSSPPQKAIGLNWYITHLDDQTRIYKNGANSGFSSYISFIPEMQMGVVLLSNGKPPPKTQSLTQTGNKILKRLTPLPLGSSK